jgi:hypothetical protein
VVAAGAADATVTSAAPGKPAAAPNATPPAWAPDASTAAADASTAAEPSASAAGGSAPDDGGAAAATKKSGTVVADARQKPADDFLLWVEQSNDDQPPPRQASRYVSAEATGADALDRYGRWDALPDSEAVWFPTSVPEDWAPYRFGHWDRIEPWGWTWVDDQPWGFAPFHYGRWVNIDGHWGWVPGAVEPHPVYAPALVAFVDTPGDAGGNGPAAGPDGGPDAGPPVGWFPLAPGDDYQPWYPAGPDYVASVNAPERRHFRDFAARGYGERGREPWRGGYFNRRYATVVSRAAFADSRRLDRGMMRQVAAERLEHAAVMRGGPHIIPAVMRSPAGPGEFRGEPGGEHRGEPRGATPAGMAAGGLHERPGGGFEREPGVAGRNPRQESERGGEHLQQGFGRAEAGHGAIAGRAAAAPYSHAEGARIMPAAVHGEARQSGRPQVFQTSAPGFRGAAPQQSGRPAVAEGFRGGAPQQFARPEVSQGFRGAAPQQFGRPQAAQSFRGAAPQQFAQPAVSPGFRGAAPQQFGRPQVAQSFRGGAPQQFARPAVSPGSRGAAPQQFGRPQVAQTPAASFRGGGMTGRPAPQMVARPAPHVSGGGGGGGRHK